MYKIAFVIPWYGEGIPGGAEMELREVAGHLQKAGVEVEVLTTCVKDFTADWNQNYYAAGVAMVYDVPTRRFPVRKRDTATFDRINAQRETLVFRGLAEEQCPLQGIIFILLGNIAQIMHAIFHRIRNGNRSTAN